MRPKRPATTTAPPVATRSQRAAAPSNPLPDSPRSVLPSSFGSLQLGFGVDGAARRDGRATLDGVAVADLTSRTTRALGFGDVAVGSRGFGVRSLATFMALNFQTSTVLQPLPIPDAINKTAYAQLRSGWAEVRNVAELAWTQPLRVRAGRHYASTVWPTHFDGLTVGWDTPVVQAAFFGGTAVLDFNNDAAARANTSTRGVSGASVVVALRNSKRKTPMTISFDALLAYAHTHSTVTVAYQPRRDVFASVSARALDQRVVQERLQVRAVVSDITHVSVDVEHRHDNDWQWDPSWVRDDTSAGTAKRYLELGPMTPQVHAALRGGTVLLDNIDLFGRVAVAVDRSPVRDRNTLRPSWFEVGGGAELRLRRAVALTASSLFRDLRRRITQSTIDVRSADGQPLLLDAHYGEQSILEGGAGLRLTLGAKRFSVATEYYLRRTKFTETYIDQQQLLDATPIIPGVTFVGGGRVKIDAWISTRLRVLAIYELTSRSRRTPELNGFNSLRVAIEGAF
ncbi:MAG: hypothetical protein KBG15_01155 [Kofleriaceae bacterium]|nr:hypothetical protein [Kofleriaceae bacterium]